VPHRTTHRVSPGPATRPPVGRPPDRRPEGTAPRWVRGPVVARRWRSPPVSPAGGRSPG